MMLTCCSSVLDVEMNLDRWMGQVDAKEALLGLDLRNCLDDLHRLHQFMFTYLLLVSFFFCWSCGYCDGFLNKNTLCYYVWLPLRYVCFLHCTSSDSMSFPFSLLTPWLLCKELDWQNIFDATAWLHTIATWDLSSAFCSVLAHCVQYVSTCLQSWLPCSATLKTPQHSLPPIGFPNSFSFFLQHSSVWSRNTDLTAAHHICNIGGVLARHRI